MSKSAINIDTASGLLLLATAILGFFLKNSAWEGFYDSFVSFPITFAVPTFSYAKPLIFWVNDGLIAIFFFLVGLEMKSYLYGHGAKLKQQLTLPLSAAIAGVMVPALIYTAFNFNNPINMRGWAIPTAIDTAFVVGLLSLLGDKIPRGLRMLLIMLSIIDDVIAVLIIALFYAGELSHFAALASASIIGILVMLNYSGVVKATPYLFLGLVLWVCVLGSGVHASIAGVLLAATIPYDPDEHHKNLVDKLKDLFHPIVGFLIMPIFAFVNTGIDLDHLDLRDLLQPLALGIILGLFIGKQLGIFGITFLLHRFKVCRLPHNVSWRKMYGASVLCGIGFTMSLFIGILAFESGGPEYNDLVKAAVFMASICSAVLGMLILATAK